MCFRGQFSISVYPKPCSCTFEQLHLGTFAKFWFSVLITDLERSRRDEQNDTTLSFSNKVLPSAVYRNTANTAEIPRAVRGTSKTYRGTTLLETYASVKKMLSVLTGVADTVTTCDNSNASMRCIKKHK